MKSLAAISICVFFVAGCNSVRFGPTLAREEPTVVRATFGPPTAEVHVQQPAAAKLDPPQAPPAPPVEEPSNAQAIDLATALARAGADNPTIALAEEAVRFGLAERMQARALLFPTLDVGANLRVHRGNFLNGRGAVTDVDIQSLYWGFGADAKGAGTLAVPGLRVVSHLADAWYAPQAAQYRVIQTRLDSAAARQYLLMEVGIRYLALVEAQARRQAYRQSLEEFGAIEKLTAGHAKAEQGRESDAQRARAEAMLLRAEAQRAEEAIGVAAAELARLLVWDPSLPLRGADAVPPLLEFVHRDVPLTQLLEQALANHPEIAASDAAVAYHETLWRQEKMRPFLPLIAVGFSAGEFGGSGPGTTSRLAVFNARTDLDVVAVWSLPNLGAGSRAVQNIARTGVDAAQIERAAVFDRIRREVVEAHALVEARRQDIALAQKRIESSQRAYNQELVRAKNLQALPIEVLKSANQLADARQDLVRAMVGFSQAQLQLHAALGNAP